MACNCAECESYRVDEGALARLRGEPLNANPYDGAAKRQWEIGWLHEDKALRTGK